jgi:hypothetical protein
MPSMCEVPVNLGGWENGLIVARRDDYLEQDGVISILKEC